MRVFIMTIASFLYALYGLHMRFSVLNMSVRIVAYEYTVLFYMDIRFYFIWILGFTLYEYQILLYINTSFYSYGA